MSGPPDPKLVLGPFLLGVMFNIGLEGALILQFFHYWDTFRNDKTWVRLFVLYLFILETLNTAFGIAIVWEPLMTRYAEPAAMMFFPTCRIIEPFVTTLISTPMQIFVAWRIYAGTRSAWLPLAIVVCAIGSIAGAYWTGVTVIIVKTFLRKEEVNHPSIVWSSFTTAADVFMTVGLTYILVKNRKKNPHHARGVTRAIQVTIQTGIITAIFALLDVILFNTQPVRDFGLSKLYTNILISCMNARAAPSNVNMVANIHNALFGDDTGPYAITKGGNGQFESSASEVEGSIGAGKGAESTEKVEEV
ncbi:MFS domain-containing protein [Favolaschia claudopus]|uniref:MFS domain-containing protein n=1 Tax=Favolaschia claudopus TaxID=2862362 RepID=A0AAW0BPT1_9AGAR